MLQNSPLPEIPSASIENRQTEDAGNGPVSDGIKEEVQGSTGEEGDRNSAANRWPREETMALLMIRSDMDVAFRDISPKTLLWEEVSRRLSELGYNRSAKKCKEKFENIYKYHRRTKGGRYGKPNSKTYRFFEQLEALHSHPVIPPTSPEKNPGQAEAMAKTTTPTPLPIAAMPYSIRLPGANITDHSSSTTSSSSKESGDGTRKKKRKSTGFFEKLMKEVIQKQENLQKKFMEVLEKCEQDRIAREDAWKMQELARIEKERELLAQERSIAAAKDAAVLAFLKKFTEQAGAVQLPEKILVENPISDQKDKDKQENGNEGGVIDKQEYINGGNYIQTSSSRWPKDEVEALIRLRTNLDVQYEGTGPKSSLWEEISSAMKKIGYDRSAKRCKEKWENINKYFKRMKEQNKKRPEDSKTCPYFHQLDALYSKKPKKGNESGNSGNELGGQEELQQLESSSDDADRENTDQDQGDKEERDGDGYPMEAATSPSMAIMD